MNRVGRFEGILFENLPRFEEALLSPTRTTISVGAMLAEVRASLHREKALLDVLSSTVSARRFLLLDLAGQMEAEAVRLSIRDGDVADLETRRRDAIEIGRAHV